MYININNQHQDHFRQKIGPLVANIVNKKKIIKKNNNKKKIKEIKSEWVRENMNYVKLEREISRLEICYRGFVIIYI